jgi:hydrogenase maturation protein HypF
MDGLRFHIRGIVQGVGFRPYVYGLATSLKLRGWVRNSSAGVEIEIVGSRHSLSEFHRRLLVELPPLARVDTLEVHPMHGNFPTFTIVDSADDESQFIPVSPDVAICPDCVRELFDPSDRRFRYPFINCTNCGPRFTIIREIPYDRPLTTMAGFPLCHDCQKEYEDPANRRFHAQPIACPVCGPQLHWSDQLGNTCDGEDALLAARQALKDGMIVAVKGIGGYHLACDAFNATAVDELRRRKRRSRKPFAVMANSLETIAQHCIISEYEASLLTSPAAPITLLKWHPDSAIAPSVAPHQQTLGVMLPYTPLHYLLLEPASEYPAVLVMTSGNLGEEPIAYLDGDAQTRLLGLADGFLGHNRPIHMRMDDSVVRVHSSQPYPIRRSRGYAPQPTPFPLTAPSILATGAELKNTFCLTRENYAFMSHHIGDMENFETLTSFEEAVAHYEKLFRIHPAAIACDLHPNYLASRYARQRAELTDTHLIEIQHHHAHLASVLADNGWKNADPVIGLCMDGTGYGDDGAIWGGEILIGGYAQYTRFAHLAYIPMPGGDASVKKPARMALAHLSAAQIPWQPTMPAVSACSPAELHVVQSQLNRNINAPLTSSLGRLFDAVSAFLGVCTTANYEGEAAIMLEAIADPEETGAYLFPLHDGIIALDQFWSMIVADWEHGVSAPVMSARFHNGLARSFLDICDGIRKHTGLVHVALSGGVWQNMTLLAKTERLLSHAGFAVLIHSNVPANDGGLALGQAAIAAWQLSVSEK